MSCLVAASALSAHDQHPAALPVALANDLPQRFGVELAGIGRRRINLRGGNAGRPQRGHGAGAGRHEAQAWRQRASSFICYAINSYLRPCILR